MEFVKKVWEKIKAHKGKAVVVGVGTISFLGLLWYFTRKDETERWIENASHEELSNAYEIERLDWIKNGFNGGTGRKTPIMNRLTDEINKRVAEEWENSPSRNRDPNYRWTDANRWDKD